jgi:DNA-binding transcriptional LysR family regulator
MVVVCASTHELGRRKTVALSDLADRRQADLPSSWGIRLSNDRAFAALGQHRRLLYEMNDVDELLDIVASGLALAIMPRSVRKRSPALHYLAIEAPAPRWAIGVAVPRGKEPSPAARALFGAILPRVPWPDGR